MGSFQMCFQAAVRRTCRGQKNCSAMLRITAPLLRRIEIEHHKHHLGNIQPLKRMIKPHVGIIKPHLGISKPVEALNKLHVNISSLRSYTLRKFAVPVVTTTFIDQTSAKAVACLHGLSCTRTSYLNENYVSIGLTKHFHAVDIRSSDMGVSLFVGSSPCLTEFETNSCCKTIAKHVKRRRDREPSRLSMKKILRSMKKRKRRCKVKDIVRKSTPKSSRLYNVVIDHKSWYVRYNNRCDCFFASFLNLRGLIGNKMHKSKQAIKPCLPNHKKEPIGGHTKRYCALRVKLLMSGDIELNPGPEDSNRQNKLSLSSTILLNYRLRQLGLRPVDVGGAGDCFFRAVSHQLCGDPGSHLYIRQIAIKYLQENPELFIESNTENSWNEYLTNMSQQGSWCDALMVQAVAESQNLRIRIVESHENFAETTMIEPVHISEQPPATIYVGHVDEVHYVSTMPYYTCTTHLLESPNSHQIGVIQNVTSEQSPSKAPKRKRNGYMKKYRKKKAAENRSCDTTTDSKNNAYMREYRKRKADERKKTLFHTNDSRMCTLNMPGVENEVQTQNTHPTNKNLNSESDCQNKEAANALSSNNANIQNMDFLILKFHSEVSQGPLYICSCCDQLWYKHCVSCPDALKKSNPAVAQKYFLNRKSVQNKEWLCRTCHNYLAKNKVPPAAVVNGMHFPPIPDFFDLNELECRLLAPRLAFQKLMQAPRGRQLKIHGNVVNVPAEVSSTVNMLPRLPTESGTIKVKLKRRLQYKSSALSLNIRPHKVIQAAKWLVSNSSLYRQEGISVNENWGEQCIVNCLLNDNSVKNQDMSTQDDANCINDIGTSSNCDEALKSEDQWSEDEIETPAGVTDTMLTNANFVENTESRYILSVAPGEGNKPLSIFRDQYSEELAYPGIFLGQKRPENKDRLVSVHYSDICKSELRRNDRRAAMCVENIFFKTKKLQMKILLGKSQVALRKCKGNTRSLNASQLSREGAVEKLIHHDEGFQFLRALRGSPPYFEKTKKDLFAMIRQLGPASLFCSFSSAETKWIHLLRILGQLVDKKKYTNVELENMNWNEKCRLIQSDPVTCARHFDYQISQFLTNFLLKGAQPLGNVSDWFYRVEYQQQGSPHVHMLIWLESAPVFGVDDDDVVTDFIDQTISCKWPVNNRELQNLVNRQINRHSHTCRKKSKNECRFNYPQPPMRATKILYPLENNIPLNEIVKHKDLWKDLKKQLNDLKNGECITFDELLIKLKVTECDYILAVRSSLHSPTIFLKREPNELRINNYNPTCLKAWRANMDIQFVLDVYACAVYIVSYISKAQKGMSELLQQACNEARKGNSNIKQQVRDVGSKFLNSVEISAQEAVYIILQLPMKKSSRQVVFINTTPPDERVQLLKPIDEIKEMEDECEDIYTGGLLQRYANRPNSHEHLTLADWAAWYDSSGQPYVKKSFENDTDNLPRETANGEDNDDEISNENTITEKKSKKRARARIIRSVWFNKEKDVEKHFRELIMLFTPWRNEETDLIAKCSSYEERFYFLKDGITEQVKQYAVFSDELDKIQEQMLDVHDNDDYFDSVAPFTQNIEYEDEA